MDGCTDGVKLQASPRAPGSATEQVCPDTPLRPAGICESPDGATDCEKCRVWGCKTPGTAGDCKEKWDEQSCLEENPSAARRTCFPEFKIVFSNESRFNKQPLQLVNKRVQLFV